MDYIMDFINSFFRNSKRIRTKDEINHTAISQIKTHNAGAISVYGGVTYYNNDTDTYITIEPDVKTGEFAVPKYLADNYLLC